MPSLLEHLNGNLLCGIDIETTGLDFEKHDIYEIAIIPLNGNLERDVKRPWLDLCIKPLRESNIDWSGVHKVKNPARVKEAIERGLDPGTAAEIIQHWFDRQCLGTKLIAPIGHNYTFESRFLRTWMGHLHYEAMFADWEIRDTMIFARMMNDISDFRTEPYPYAKVNLNYVASLLKVNHDYGRAHTAIADAAVTIEIYKRQLEELNKKMLF